MWGEFKNTLWGNVSADNCGSFMEEGDIDGVLVGGSSLNVSEFEKIVRIWLVKVGYRPGVFLL